MDLPIDDKEFEYIVTALWKKEIIVGLLFFIMGYGLYLTIGPGKTDLRDPIDEHAKMHELGIAHGHGGNSEAYKMSGKLEHNHD
jgi:hypothetical protein